MMPADPVPENSVTVYIARCPEHGLHGERDECFVCGGPVEQVPMRPLYSDPNSRVDGGSLVDDARQALDAWRETQGLGPSRLDDEDIIAEAVIGYAHKLRQEVRSHAR